MEQKQVELKRHIVRVSYSVEVEDKEATIGRFGIDRAIREASYSIPARATGLMMSVGRSVSIPTAAEAPAPAPEPVPETETIPEAPVPETETIPEAPVPEY